MIITMLFNEKMLVNEILAAKSHKVLEVWSCLSICLIPISIEDSEYWKAFLKNVSCLMVKCYHLSLKGGQGDVLTCSWNGDKLVLTHSYLYRPIIIRGLMEPCPAGAGYIKGRGWHLTGSALTLSSSNCNIMKHRNKGIQSFWPWVEGTPVCRI